MDRRERGDGGELRGESEGTGLGCLASSTGGTRRTRPGLFDGTEDGDDVVAVGFGLKGRGRERESGTRHDEE